MSTHEQQILISSKTNNTNLLQYSPPNHSLLEPVDTIMCLKNHSQPAERIVQIVLDRGYHQHC